MVVIFYILYENINFNILLNIFFKKIIKEIKKKYYFI